MGIIASNELVLGSAVTSPAGTFTVAYPAGMVQADFTSANAATVAYMIVNGNDRYEEVDDEFDISYDASYVTVTNKTGATLAAGSKIIVGLSNALPITIDDLREFGPIASLTDSSTGTAGDTLAATLGIQTVAIPIQLAAMTTSAADLMTNYTPGYAFELLSAEFVTTTIGAGSGASQVLNFEIGTTNVTGGAITITLSGTDTLGKKTAGTSITAANTGTASDTISLEVAASGTVFTGGAGFVLLKLRNMDTVNAIASLAAKVNALLSGLRSSALLATS
jgi:hypothetical protein